MVSCAFAGHREVYGANVDALLEVAIENLLKKDISFTFYTGDMGEFDQLCSSAVRTAKRQHPALDIRLIAVLPYMMTKINACMMKSSFQQNCLRSIIKRQSQRGIAGWWNGLII